jgi:hypothetical protein
VHNAVIESIRTAAADLAETNDSLKEAVSEGLFTSSDVIPSTDYTTSDLSTAISTLCNFAAGIDLKDSGPFVPRSFLDALLSKLNDIQAQCVEVRNAFGNSNGGTKNWNKDAFIVTYRNDAQYNFSKQLRGLYGRIDGAFAAWYQLRTVLRTPRISEFGRLASQLEQRSSTLIGLDEQINETKTQISENLERSRNDLEVSTAAKAEIDRLLKEAESSRKTISEYAAEATNRAAEIKSVEEKAATLSATVGEYQAEFEAFDEELQKRTERFERENAQLDEIHSSLNSDEAEIKRLIEQSEGLLRGATNVGLAASFSSLQEKIDNELRWARRSFYLSIAILIFLSIPIALYVFPDLKFILRQVFGLGIDAIIPKSMENHTSQEILAQIAARALLLVPGIWLVRFTSARHERLFRLREHYAYKYSIASSVEGFKRQAPDLEQGIAATAFYELTFNPATRMDVSSTETRYPNPAMDWFLKKLGGAPEGGN